MRSLIGLNGGELLDGKVGVHEACASEIAGLELLESLLVELGLELLEDVCEL